MLFCGILHLSRGKKIMKKGDIVYGIITNIIGYGAFVTVNDYTGLIHISEFSDNYVRNISDFVEVGEKVKLKVIEVDETKKRLKLSYNKEQQRRHRHYIVATHNLAR